MMKIINIFEISVNTLNSTFNFDENNNNKSNNTTFFAMLPSNLFKIKYITNYIIYIISNTKIKMKNIY